MLEYKVIELNLYWPSQREVQLNELAAHGWRLVAVVERIAYMERGIPLRPLTPGPQATLERQ